MGRSPCCDKSKVKRGPWSPEEDTILRNHIQNHGTGGNWIALPHKAGLKRCGKSCRLRWLNYLRPDIKLGGFTEEEDHIISSLYLDIGSRWSVIASHLQGRTDNDVKNHWNTKLKKKLLTSHNSMASISPMQSCTSTCLPKQELDHDQHEFTHHPILDYSMKVNQHQELSISNSNSNSFNTSTSSFQENYYQGYNMPYNAIAPRHNYQSSCDINIGGVMDFDVDLLTNGFDFGQGIGEVANFNYSSQWFEANDPLT